MNNLNYYEDFATKIANMITFSTLQQKKEVRDLIMFRLVNAHLHKDSHNDVEMRNYLNYYQMKNKYD